MGVIHKVMQPKHKDTLSPWLQGYIDTTVATPLPLLPQHLDTFPSRWPFGRGDLYHWVPLLNRFDGILEAFCSMYRLDMGPQERDFGQDLLLEHSGETAASTPSSYSAEQLIQLGFSSDGDRQLVESILKFSRMLLEHCGNRSIYASSERLNDLLNTTSLSTLLLTLRVGSELAQRYQASVKRVGNASRQIGAALLANHYNIDLDRVQQLALPFVKTPLLSFADLAQSQTPETSKGQEKAVPGSTRAKGANATTFASDLVALATSPDAKWRDWADVKVLYYPQETTASNKHPEQQQGTSSTPASPTPLRRSSTLGSQQQTPKARHMSGDDSSPLLPRTPGIADEGSSSGQKSFELPQSTLSQKPIHELLLKIPADMPASVRYEAFHRLRVAKALLGDAAQRQQLLATRLLAITNLAYIHNETSFLEKVLRHDAEETRKFQLVYQLAELIHPSTDGRNNAPLWLQSLALALLEAISGFNSKCQDVLSALNANVNHGILLYVIRKAVAGMKEEHDQDADIHVSDIDEWRSNLFSLTLHLSMATRIGSEMVSAGLMDILVDMLNIRSRIAQRHHSMVLAFLDGLIWTYQNAFTAFFNADGLDAVANLVVDSVTEAKDLQSSGHGIATDQHSSVVDYEIPYYQQQTLKWLLKFIHHIMSNSYSYNGNTDRLLRNLSEKSDLLGSLREIIRDKKEFGSVVWTNTVTILSDFINNDPTSFAAISEAGMISTYLEAITGKSVDTSDAVQESSGDTEGPGSGSPDSSGAPALADLDERPHPPSEMTIAATFSAEGSVANGILPTSEAINVVPQVLNSVSLNRAGMKLVVTSRAFDSFFRIFESPAHVKCMVTDENLANNVGGSFDELARHHPSLRTSISNAVIDMAARVRFIGTNKATTAGWGAQLYINNTSGNLAAVDAHGGLVQPSLKATAAPKDVAPTDEDVDMAGAATPQQTNPDTRTPARELQRSMPSESFVPYVFALANFFTAYLSNNVLKTSFIEKGGIELLLDICESPSLPDDFGETLASRVLNSVLSQLVDSSPIRGLPSLLQRAQQAIDTLQPLVTQRDGEPAYFASFLIPDLAYPPPGELQQRVVEGTRVAKALLNAQSYIKVLSDCFFTSRSNALQFYAVNVYDYYLKLVNSLGPMLRAVLAEEAAQYVLVPQHWSSRKRPSDENVKGQTQDNNLDIDVDDTSMPGMLGSSASWNLRHTGNDVTSQGLTEQERSSPRYQNYETLWNLLHPVVPTTFPFFQSMGKALLPRREGDGYPRPRHLEMAKALANTVLGHLGPSVEAPGPGSKQFHYWIIMIHTLHEMMIDHPMSRPSDRSNVQLIMPTILAFKEQGGLETLKSMLKCFAETVKQGSAASSDEPSKPRIAAFGIRKILELYSMIVNGKYITDMGGHFTLVRHSERQLSTAGVYQQIVVELRADILPAVMDLWVSPLIETLPEVTIKRLLEVLKTIASGDHEPATLPSEKPFDMFKLTQTRFNWRPVRDLVNELISADYTEDLVHEAVYRSNGNPQAAREYCQAHKEGRAGHRNPIPQEDSKANSPPDPDVQQPDNGRRPSARSATDVDRMSLDMPHWRPPPFDRDMANRSSQVAVEATQAEDTNEPMDAANAVAATPSDQPSASDEPRLTQSFAVTVQEFKATREKLRNNLIAECLDVIRAHPGCAMEVSELISTASLQHSPQAAEEIGDTLTLALSSFGFEEEDKKHNGKYIAAYAHLLALLLQNPVFFDKNADALRDRVAEYVSLLKVVPSTSVDDLPPWLPYVLLIIETMLSRDERPTGVEWKTPKSLEESVSTPVVEMRTWLVDNDQRVAIVTFLIELLPRIGKEQILATSVLRVLVVLTRNHELAKTLGEKKNLQRLFLMVKQLCGTGSERLNQSRLVSHSMAVLRHIVEDRDTVKQVMRAEIRAEFPNLSRNQRGHPDVAAYLRAMDPVALRAPDLFVDVTNEMLKFARWSPSSGDGPTRSQPLMLKDQGEHADEAKKNSEAETPHQDVKPSTESLFETPKPESKRPVVENPDGVVHFLLCELINYREVDDKEPVVTTDSNAESEVSAPASAHAAGTSLAGDNEDKKPSKPAFKAEEHPIFVYRCFLLNCLAELLHSYNRTKVEFINFKRSAPPLLGSTPVKPRSSVLNYLIYDLLCQGSLSGSTDSIAQKKKAATSYQTQKVLVALVAKTNEKVVDKSQDKYAYDDDPDLLFVRKFVLDTILKAYERAPISDETFEIRYSRMQSLAQLMNQMTGERDKHQSSRGSANEQARSQAQLRRLMYEKNYLDKLTTSIAEINLNYPDVKRAVKYILRVLRVLTDTAKELSHSNIIPSDASLENDEIEVGSSSSLSEFEDDREETPDLYRNSALGMLEPRGEDDESEDDDEDDDEDMYGDEYDDEEMEYGDDDISDGEDNISDEDEELGEMGEIEGLHGDPGVVEVIMDEDDEDDDDVTEDEDDVESADMHDIDSNGEIIDEDGNPLTDDGNSEWESDDDGEDDGEDDEDEDGPSADEIDYEADVAGDPGAHIHGMSHGDLLDNMARAIMGGDPDYEEPELMDDYDGQFADDALHADEDDIEDDLDDEEYIYDDDYPHEDPPAAIPSLGWDGLNAEMDDPQRQFLMIGDQNRRMVARMRDPRNPFPPRFVGGPGRGYVDDFRSYFGRNHRSGAQSSNQDDGMNPLLRRSHQDQDNASRPGQSRAGIRFPDILAGGRGGNDGPMGFIGELMEFLPMVGRGGQQAFQFHITGVGGHPDSRDVGPIRVSRHEHRRDASTQEPHQAVSFNTESTLNRYQEEARMIFGSNHATEIGNLVNVINSKLIPPAIEQEKKLRAEEAEKQKRLEEEVARKREEERQAQEAKAAEEKAAQEKKEAEEQQAAKEAALENAGESTETHGDGDSAMEGVESTEAHPSTSEQTQSAPTSTADQPRVMTVIRGEEVDVTELGIDPDYLAALPEEFREEVIAQTVSERRSQAREAQHSGPVGESGEAFQEFLNALPEDLRLEIAQQERQEERRRVREDGRRHAVAGGGQVPVAAEMDASSILLTLPPELRDQVLIEQGEDIMEQLNPDMAARARALGQQHPGHAQPRAANPAVQIAGPPVATGTEQRTGQQDNKARRRTVVQMLDKAGVATLLRLMFVTQQGSIRNYLFSIFTDVCENRQNRLEVVNTVLQILQDGSTDMNAVERSFSHLSLKARKQRDKDKETEQKTPQSLKRTLTNLNFGGAIQTNSETSPLLVVQQCLDLLVDLCTKNPHIPWLFLTEHETFGPTLKRSLSRKGKGKDSKDSKDSKAHKFAINSVLTLLDRDLVMESSVVMSHLADLLNRITLPLLNLERRRKEAEGKSSNAEPTKADAQQSSEGGQMSEAAATTSNQATDKDAEKTEGKKGAENRSKARPMQPPVVPAHNLTLVVRVFVARECSSKTFQNTISTIKNLSVIPEAKQIFGQELLVQARQLSENIVSDLNELLPQIDKAVSGTDIQGVALAKFSPGASEQNKLLRVLTALDHLFETKKKGDRSTMEAKHKDAAGQDLVMSLYHNSTFSAMWDKLSACLGAIRQRENMLSVATILLPLIESLMVVCKNTTTLDDPTQNHLDKTTVLSSPPAESRIANLFFSFTDDHRRVLNELVRNNPKLMSGTFSLLVKNPKVLDFDNKRNYFNRSVHSRSGQGHNRSSYPPLQLSVRRDHVFHDSFKSLYFKSGDEIKFGKLSIRFHGEEGVDAGGVTREWFQVLARQMFDPNYVLFIPVSSDRTTFHPNKLSSVNEEHLMFFKFIGRIIGKALYEGRLLDCFFSRAVYKRILGKSVSVKDMESFDPDYYKSLCWMLDNDITDIITETFSVEDDAFGVTNVVDLVPNGREIAVTEENKAEYVRLVVEHKLLYSVKEQMGSFLKGFHEIIPEELISIFNEQELELLISGLPDIDIDDWKANTEYQNYNPSSQQIQWFWRALRSFDKEERAKMLQFVTGTSKVPLNGFKELEGMNGVNRFNIHRDYSSTDRLPTSHTCFNQLDLPEYESYDALRSQIMKAITAGSEYFGFA